MSISLSQSAVDKVRGLIDDEGNPALALRVFVTGGGCSGFSYGFTFDELDNDADEEEAVIEADGVRVVIDPMSFQYLDGSSINYKEDLQGAQFVVENPNAATTCGCGNSFSI